LDGSTGSTSNIVLVGFNVELELGGDGGASCAFAEDVGFRGVGWDV